MEKSGPITIVVATNNFYAILLSALLKSIEVNHKTAEKIHVHVIDDGISKKNIDSLSRTVSSEMFTFFWHKSASVISGDVTLPNDPSALPVTAYLRLFAPYLVPKETRKLIYLDVDMIMLKDISSLWNIDLGGKTIGAVQANCKTVGSSWGGIPNYKELGLNPSDKYFNSGLLLIDPVKWREENITYKVIKTNNENVKSVLFADQYGLNVVFINQWLELDYRWNCYADNDYQDPFLIHYLNVKPIFSSYKSKRVYFDLFHSYLKQTPYKNFKIYSNNRLLFMKAVNKIRKIKSNLLTKQKDKAPVN